MSPLSARLISGKPEAACLSSPRGSSQASRGVSSRGGSKLSEASWTGFACEAGPGMWKALTEARIGPKASVAGISAVGRLAISASEAPP